MDSNILSKFLLQNSPVLGDSAIGTCLPGHQPSPQFCLTNPGLVLAKHQADIEAGATIITTNSFGANRCYFGKHKLDDVVIETNKRAAEIAREAALSKNILVAGCIGPLGEFLTPYGNISHSQAHGIFFEQATALARSGIDFFLIETMSSLDEAKAAITAAENCGKNLPIAVTFSFGKNNRTMFGIKPEMAFAEIYGFGVKVIGANCSLKGCGLEQMLEVLKIMAQVKTSDSFLVAQPNGTAPQKMAAFALQAKDIGVSWMGGCCGTTPHHIQAMSQALRQ